MKIYGKEAHFLSFTRDFGDAFGGIMVGYGLTHENGYIFTGLALIGLSWYLEMIYRNALKNNDHG